MAVDFASLKRALPTLGVGLGLRRELAHPTLESSAQIDWLEFVPENYMQLGGMADERLDIAAGIYPLISHGVNLSIGSTDPLNLDYLKALKLVLERTKSAWFSDHLCFTSVDGVYLHDLLPLPFNKETVKHVAERIKRVVDFIERPFLIENISFYMNMPESTMSDGQFLAEVVEAADCGILLDVNNVYVNSQNYKHDPLSYIEQIPLERVVQMHVAGHKQIGQHTIDTHGAPVIGPVVDLYKEVLAKTKVHAVLLERDQNFPDFAEILGEIAMLKAAAADIQPELAGCGNQLRDASRTAIKVMLKEPATKGSEKHEVLA